MSDNLTKRHQPDRSKINTSEDYEVKYWTHSAVPARAPESNRQGWKLSRCSPQTTQRRRAGANLMASEQETRKFAHQLWEKAGLPDGREEEFWHGAEIEEQQEAGNAPGGYQA